MTELTHDSLACGIYADTTCAECLRAIDWKNVSLESAASFFGCKAGALSEYVANGGSLIPEGLRTRDFKHIEPCLQRFLKSYRQ